MSEAQTGHEVVAQAADNSITNTDPVALSQTIMQIIGVVVAFAVFKGFIQPEEGAFITAQSLILVGAIISIAAFIGAALGRSRAYSPRSAAKVAVLNAESPVGAPPVLPKAP